MSDTPPLGDGEHVTFDHVPSLVVFKKRAVVLLLATLPVVVVFLVVFPDTLWPAVPLFVSCVLLMQERVTLGKYRAWVTNKRVLLQGGRVIDATTITSSEVRGSVVAVMSGGVRMRLQYSDDPTGFKAAVDAAREGV